MTPEPYKRAVDAVHAQAPLLSIAREIHRSDRGAPIMFADKPYLIALYLSLPHMERAVFRKAVQTGVSEALIQLMLYKSGWLGQKCAYALPDNKIAGGFVADRINPLIESVPAYRRMLPHGDDDGRVAETGSVSRKRFGPGFMRFMGATTKSNWVEFSTDLFIIDEVDLCPAEHVAMAPDRIKASLSPSLIYVGNPTNEGEGIDAMYTAGTRGSWFQRCDRCGERQRLDWFLHFVQRADSGLWVPRDSARADSPSMGDLRPVCARCSRPFERTGEKGQWVHEREKTRATGASFTNSHMDMLPRSRDEQPMRDMVIEWHAAQSSDEKLVAFHQSRLGLPKRPQGASMTVEMLRAVATGRPMDPNGETVAGKMLVMSSDVGSTFHVTVAEIIEDLTIEIGYRRRPIWYGTTTTWTGLHAIHDRFLPGITVVDAGPEGTAAREFCARAEQKVEGMQAFRCAFHQGARVAGKEMALSMDRPNRLVTVDRTQAMDRAFYDIRDAICIMPSDVLSVPNWGAQMCKPVRAVKDDGTAYWTKGEDHFRLSDTYNRVGLQIAAQRGCITTPERK